MSRKQSGSTQEFHFCFSTMSTHIFLLVTLFLVFCTNNWLLFPVSRQLQFSQWGQNFYKVPFEFVYTNRSQKNFSYFIRRQEKEKQSYCKPTIPEVKRVLNSRQAVYAKTVAIRDVMGNPFLEFLAIFQPPIPRGIEFSTPKSNFYDNFLHFFESFYKEIRDPHYIWLFLILILSILIMKIILFFWFQKKFQNKNSFQ